MKKLFWIFLSTLIIAGGSWTTAEAQRQNGRKHSQRGSYKSSHNKHYKKGRNHYDRKDHYRRERRDNYRHERRKTVRSGDRHYGDRRYGDRHYDKYRKKHYRHPNYRKVRHHRAPRWARAHRYQAKYPVYFRDYHMFYDPYRNGYVYYRNNNWLFSRTVPAFVANIDLGRAHIQIMSDIPVRSRPELYYERYVRRYPAQINVNIPLPHLPRF